MELPSVVVSGSVFRNLTVLGTGLWGFCHMVVKTTVKTVPAKIGFCQVVKIYFCHLAKTSVNNKFCTICQQITVRKVKTSLSNKIITTSSFQTVWMNSRRQSNGHNRYQFE